MKKVFVILLVLSLALFLVVFPVVAQVSQSDPCEDHRWYADDLVAWCIPEGWASWSRFSELYGSQSDLAQMLDNVYENVGTSDLGDFGDDIRVAVQVHEVPVNAYLMAAQLFVTDYDTDYKSPEDLILDTYIEYDDAQYFFSLDVVNDVPIGVVYLEFDNEDVSRLWFMYPFEEIGRTYTISIFLDKNAWNSADPEDDINLIAYSLFVPEEPSPVATEEFQ